MPTIHQRHGGTDGRTTYDSNTALALRASRGKKRITRFQFKSNRLGYPSTQETELPPL